MTGRPDLPEPWRDQFKSFRCDGWEGWVDSCFWYEGIEEDLRRPQEFFSNDRVISWFKKDRNRLAEIAWPAGLQGDASTIVLKSYEAGSAFNRLRLMLGEPRALRHWNASWLLQQSKINTPRPVLVALNDNSRYHQGLLAVETISNCRTIRDILRSTTPGQGLIEAGKSSMSLEAFATCCGHYAREIHDSNIVHRDFSGANILVPDHWKADGKPLACQFVMLDINRVRKISPGKMNINLRIQDLERLGIPEPVLETYYLAYAGDDDELRAEWPKFLKYWKGYRRIRETRNPLARGLLKVFTYWPRTG